MQTLLSYVRRVVRVGVTVRAIWRSFVGFSGVLLAAVGWWAFGFWAGVAVTLAFVLVLVVAAGLQLEHELGTKLRVGAVLSVRNDLAWLRDQHSPLQINDRLPDDPVMVDWAEKWARAWEKVRALDLDLGGPFDDVSHDRPFDQLLRTKAPLLLESAVDVLEVELAKIRE